MSTGTPPTDDTPIKVRRETHERIRVAAAVEGCTMGEIVTRAVGEFLAAHRAEVEAGLARAREVLARG